MMRIAIECSLDAFAAVVDADVPEGWPQFPQAFNSDLPMHREPWNNYLFFRSGDDMLVGNGGFVAPPDHKGVVEIGYEIAPEFWNKGYATAAARALIDLAFAHGAKAVIAHSLVAPNASNNVMRKVGMRFDGEVELRDQPAWRFKITRGRRAGGGA